MQWPVVWTRRRGFRSCRVGRGSTARHGVITARALARFRRSQFAAGVACGSTARHNFTSAQAMRRLAGVARYSSALRFYKATGASGSHHCGTLPRQHRCAQASAVDVDMGTDVHSGHGSVSQAQGDRALRAAHRSTSTRCVSFAVVTGHSVQAVAPSVQHWLVRASLQSREGRGMPRPGSRGTPVSCAGPEVRETSGAAPGAAC